MVVNSFCLFSIGGKTALIMQADDPPSTVGLIESSTSMLTDKQFAIKSKNFFEKFLSRFKFSFEMCFKLSALLLVVVLVEIVFTKQTLKAETTFTEELIESDTAIERNRQAEERINLSFPGTKWCGPGNTADGYDDLGSDAEIDKCCRQHDHCDNIPSGEEKHGLVNSDYFTRLHCMCDKEFKQCLRGANSRRGNYIGNFYFNVRDRCYKEQHPVVDCDEIHTK